MVIIAVAVKERWRDGRKSPVEQRDVICTVRGGMEFLYDVRVSASMDRYLVNRQSVEGLKC